jgi:hypothetical protein
MLSPAHWLVAIASMDSVDMQTDPGLFSTHRPQLDREQWATPTCLPLPIHNNGTAIVLRARIVELLNICQTARKPPASPSTNKNLVQGDDVARSRRGSNGTG